MTATRRAFLDAYRHHIAAIYPWAQDAAKLDRYIAATAETLAGGSNARLDMQSHCVLAAWAQAGGSGKPSLKKLRALPA